MTSPSLVVLSILLSRVVLATNHQVANIKGGGSTFSLQPYSSASLDFGQMYQGFQVTPYDPSNSLIGQQNVASGKLNWGGSDVSITPDLANQGLVVLPAVAGGLLITYNIPNIPTPLKLSRTLLPRIFDGTIFMWKDPRIVKDNPFLANYAGRIRIIRQSTSSGATINLRTFLTQLDVENGIIPSPHQNSSSLQTANNTLLAKSPSAAVIMIGAIPNTITYLNQYDAHDITTGSDSTVGSAWLEHKDGSYIAWSIKSVKAAIDGISPAIVQNLSFQDELIAYNSPAKGAYPLTLVSNFVINPRGISNSSTEIIATLKLLWLFLITPSYATRYDFVSLYNTPIGLRTLNYLKTITYPDSSTPVYGQSICDADVDGTYKNPCVHGTCSDPYPFQEATEVCICEFGYQNVNKNDCSEPTPIFMPGIVSKVQIVLFVLGLIVILGIGYMIIMKRNEPDVKAMSPYCCLYILGGCLLGSLAVITQGLSTTDTVCHANVILPSIAFGMIFSMILAKAIRIFLIFGYSKIARSRFLKDDFLIACSSVVIVVEGVFADRFLHLSEIDPVLMSFEGSSDTFWDCAAKPENVDTANRLFGGLIGFNAIILALCIVMGVLTRKASEKFDESKKVSVVISISTLFVVLDLAINFGIPQNTQTMYNVRRMFDSITIFLISTVTPLILFLKALGWGDSKQQGNMSHQTGELSSSHADQNDGLVRTFMFHTGLKLNRATSLWKSAVFMVMPDIDMLIILSEGNNGTYTFSHSNIKIQEKTTKAAKARTEECIELLLGSAKTSYLVEFPHKENMDEFRTLRSQAGMKKIEHGGSGPSNSTNRLDKGSQSGLNNTTRAPNQGKEETSSTTNLASFAISRMKAGEI